jgi:hypothetical protein
MLQGFQIVATLTLGSRPRRGLTSYGQKKSGESNWQFDS